MNILEFKTEHTSTFKALFDLLKDIFDDLNMECTRDDEMNKKLDDDIPNNNNDTTDNDMSSAMKTQTKKNKKKKTQQNESDDDTSNKDTDKNTNKDTNKNTNKDMNKDTNKDMNKDTDKNTDNKTNDDDKKKAGGIKIVALDKTQTLLVNVKLDAKKFDVFKMSKRVFDIGININQLFYKSLKFLQKEDSLTMSVNSKDKDYLTLKIHNNEKCYDTHDKIKLMDINKAHYDIPPCKFDAVITIDTSEFHNICKEMAQTEKVMEIRCTKKSLTFTGKGDSSGKSKTYLPADDGVKIKFDKDCKQDIVQGIYELNHLTTFTNKSQALCQRMQIFMKNNYPLVIRFTVATLGKILFCISPYDEERIGKEFDDDDEYYNQEKVEYIEE